MDDTWTWRQHCKKQLFWRECWVFSWQTRFNVSLVLRRKKKSCEQIKHLERTLHVKRNTWKGDHFMFRVMWQEQEERLGAADRNGVILYWLWVQIWETTIDTEDSCHDEVTSVHVEIPANYMSWRVAVLLPCDFSCIITDVRTVCWYCFREVRICTRMWRRK